MPRKSKAVREAEAAAEAARIAQEAAEAAQAARPFAVDSTDPYGARDDAGKLAVAEAIAAAKLAGASGNEMRERFGSRLTGPARRKVLRAHGLGNAQTIARSYDSYRDGDSRQGTRHAREHGARAAERIAEQRKADAEAEAAQATLPAMRQALRANGRTVPTVRKGDATALRAAYAAHLLAHAAGHAEAAQGA